VASAVHDKNTCAPASMEPNQTYLSLGHPRVDLITKLPNKTQNITTSFFLTFLKKRMNILGERAENYKWRGNVA